MDVIVGGENRSGIGMDVTTLSKYHPGIICKVSVMKALGGLWLGLIF
jgi:hypothetical protein